MYFFSELLIAVFYCHRELDLSVFTMLKCGLVSRSVLDSEMNTKVGLCKCDLCRKSYSVVNKLIGSKQKYIHVAKPFDRTVFLIKVNSYK